MLSSCVPSRQSERVARLSHQSQLDLPLAQREALALQLGLPHPVKSWVHGSVDGGDDGALDQGRESGLTVPDLIYVVRRALSLCRPLLRNRVSGSACVDAGDALDLVPQTPEVLRQKWSRLPVSQQIAHSSDFQEVATVSEVATELDRAQAGRMYSFLEIILC